MARFKTSDPVVTENVRSYRNIAVISRDADEELKRLKREILKFMDELSVETLETKAGLVVVTRYESYRFDSDRFRKEHPEMYAEYVKAVEAQRFTVKDV